MEYGIIGILVFIAGIYAIYHIVSSSETTTKKVLWVLGVVLFPIIGFIVWLIAGPRRSAVHI